MSDLEKQREENIKKNKELLESLGLSSFSAADIAPPKPKTKKKSKPKPQAKAKRVRDENDEPADDNPTKAARVTEESDGVRRSGRNVGRRVSYNDEKVVNSDFTPVATPLRRVSRRMADDDDEDDDDEEGMDVEKEGPAQHVGNRLGARTHNPKTYGSIPGIAVGTWWETRAQCSTDAIHAPFVAGISAGPHGAYSVALSGGYEDDVDIGHAFTYTGSGGRDLKGTPQNRKNLRTAPQSSHQTWDNPFNAALKRSVESKKPVRVIRGYKLDSEFAPAEGYRYDGLYRVEKAWMERGLNKGGFQVCKFALKRIDGQPPLPLRGENASATAEDESEDEVEEADENAAEDNEEQEPSATVPPAAAEIAVTA